MTNNINNKKDDKSYQHDPRPTHRCTVHAERQAKVIDVQIRHHRRLNARGIGYTAARGILEGVGAMDLIHELEDTIARTITSDTVAAREYETFKLKSRKVDSEHIMLEIEFVVVNKAKTTIAAIKKAGYGSMNTMNEMYIKRTQYLKYLLLDGAAFVDSRQALELLGTRMDSVPAVREGYFDRPKVRSRIMPLPGEELVIYSGWGSRMVGLEDTDPYLEHPDNEVFASIGQLSFKLEWDKRPRAGYNPYQDRIHCFVDEALPIRPLPRHDNGDEEGFFDTESYEYSNLSPVTNTTSNPSTPPTPTPTS